jgi:hypothetical protein
MSRLCLHQGAWQGTGEHTRDEPNSPRRPSAANYARRDLAQIGRHLLVTRQSQPRSAPSFRRQRGCCDHYRRRGPELEGGQGTGNALIASVARENGEGGGDDGPSCPLGAPDQDEIAKQRRIEQAQVEAPGRRRLARGDL